MASIQSYIARLKFIRPYVRDFGAQAGYDIRSSGTWSSARKAQITRYFELITDMKARATHVYRPRKKKNLANYKRAVGIQSYRKLKVGFIQAPTELTMEGTRVPVKTRVKFKKDGTMKVSYNNISRETLNFEDFGISQEQLALAPVESVKVILGDTAYDYYSITAGLFEVGRGVTNFYKGKELPGIVAALIERYSHFNYDADDKNSSYFGNWLHGVTGYNISVKQVMSYHEAQRNYLQKKDKINRKIKNAKTYIERLDMIIKAISTPRGLKLYQREYDFIKTVLKDRKNWTDKQKATRIKIKRRQIEDQNKRIRKLIVDRTKIN